MNKDQPFLSGRIASGGPAQFTAISKLRIPQAKITICIKGIPLQAGNSS